MEHLVWLMGLIYEFFCDPCKHSHILVLGWESCILKNKIGLRERFYPKCEKSDGICSYGNSY